MSGRLRIGFGKNSEPLGVAFDLTDGGLGGLEFGDVDPRCVGDASKRGRGRPFLFWSLVPFLVVTFFFRIFNIKITQCCIKKYVSVSLLPIFQKLLTRIVDISMT